MCCSAPSSHVILQCLEQACRREGLFHQSFCDALAIEPQPLQIAWADDLSLLVDFSSASEAVRLLPRLATLILHTVEAFRFRVNLGAGKTEAIVKLCGAGATQAPQERTLTETLQGSPGETPGRDEEYPEP